MATPAQILANRANAALSTGPTTTEGKAASSANAITHGATSSRIVLPHESQAEYDELCRSVHENHQPANEEEYVVVKKIAITAWRLQRLYRVESEAMARRVEAIMEANPDADGDGALALAFTEDGESKKLRLILRYVTAAERAHKQALTELENLQRDRRQRQREEAFCEALPPAEEHAAVIPFPSVPDTSRNGFVSHTEPSAAPAVLKPRDRRTA